MVGHDAAGRPSRSEAAVSSVVGTALMLAITVSVFAGFAVLVMSETGGDPAVRADLRVLAGETLVMQHRGGDSLPLDGGTLYLNVDGVEQVVPLTDLAGHGIDGDAWDVGESVCLSCLHPGQTVDGAFLVHSNTLILDYGARGSA